jgi:hypothetical protein
MAQTASHSFGSNTKTPGRREEPPEEATTDLSASSDSVPLDRWRWALASVTLGSVIQSSKRSISSVLSTGGSRWSGVCPSTRWLAYRSRQKGERARACATILEGVRSSV